MEDRVGEHCLCSFTGLRALGQHVGRPSHRLPRHWPTQRGGQRGRKEDLHGSHGGSEEDTEETRGRVRPGPTTRVSLSQ